MIKQLLRNKVTHEPNFDARHMVKSIRADMME